jgi:hypothetical protein
METQIPPGQVARLDKLITLRYCERHRSRVLFNALTDLEMHVVVVRDRSSRASVLALDDACAVFLGDPNAAAKAFSDTSIRIVPVEHDENTNKVVTCLLIRL